MTFPAYPAYRATGSDWLAKVPAGWTMERLRFHVSFNPSARSLTLGPTDEVSFVPMDNVGEWGGLRLDTTKLLDEIGTGYTYFANGDVVVAKITPCFENGKGALAEGLANGAAFGTTELHVLRPSQTIESRFLFYLTISEPFRKLGEAEMYGAGGQKRVPDRFIKDLKAPIPSLPEQRAIVHFLDARTARIDALIGKKKRLLDLLAEKRSALITRAVTKGLNPDAPMKDSGIPWLGEIPAHWEAKRLKQVARRVTVGIVVTPAKYYVEQGVIGLRSLNVKPGRFDLTDVVHLSDEGHELNSKSALQAGDVVAVRTGQPGTAAVVPPELDGANCIDLILIRPSAEVAPEFISFFMNSAIVAGQYTSHSSGSIQRHFNIETASNLFLPVPPDIEEQEAVIAHVSKLVADFASDASRINRSIALLTEHRSALITAAVTGQIDVREASEAKTAA